MNQGTPPPHTNPDSFLLATDPKTTSQGGPLHQAPLLPSNLREQSLLMGGLA